GVMRVGEGCRGVTGELETGQLVVLGWLYYCGGVDHGGGGFPALIRDAQERGDLYAATNLLSRLLYLTYLTADEPMEARSRLSRVMEEWSHQGFYHQHYFSLIGQVDTEIYSGNGEAAWRLIGEQWPILGGSKLECYTFVLIESLHARAICALAAAAESGNPSPMLAAAKKDAERIEGEEMAWGNGLARLIRAAIASAEGREREAEALLRTAEKDLNEADMGLY